MSPIIPFDRSRGGARPAAPAGGGRLEKLFLFRLGARDLATEAVKIVEVMIAPKLATVAGAPAFVLGVANVRGNIIPVVDAHARLGEPRPDDGATQRMVVVKLAGDYVGFLVDGVDLRLTEGLIEAPPARKGSRGKGKLTVVEPTPAPRKAHIGEQTYPLFEPETLLTVDELETLKRVRATF
ncbi:MAG: Positive regulator of CheA protein activity (CheW) [Candidatus Ozemobacter sibiricus]|jgi:chemotaxis signal transduction protein|uniref:Positive regulator of CheA protein activity (CheW) n=1 Tax=Candidatus Ozemobacter sibiricus TaxID=2268124 RepID=A0A367ZJD0_9BACT|nr:MAG: Positive regulator of CheA protein activity (CheW) [Candidatus Ozemobacter sibiricus]